MYQRLLVILNLNRILSDFGLKDGYMKKGKVREFVNIQLDCFGRELSMPYMLYVILVLVQNFANCYILIQKMYM